MCVPPSPKAQPRCCSPDLGVRVWVWAEKKQHQKISVWKKCMKPKKKKLQLNSLFGYNHRVSESYGVQLKEGNSWEYKNMEKPPR